jgi:hypothetical protein
MQRKARQPKLSGLAHVDDLMIREMLSLDYSAAATAST